MFQRFMQALIINAEDEGNLGRGVTLLERTTAKKICLGTTHTDNPLQLPCWIVMGTLWTRNCFGLRYETRVGVIPERNLMPLDDDNGRDLFLSHGRLQYAQDTLGLKQETLKELLRQIDC